MKLLSLFSGIGAFEKALGEHELVNYCEIDKYASKSYSLIHNVSEDKNLGDITKVNTSTLPNDIDLITYGFPCQDISQAGKQKGFTDENGEHTRSGLFFEALRIIQDTKPKYAIAENVKALVGKKFKTEFNIVLDCLEKAGYNNYYKVLNAKDYGIPQNRERVFIVSIRKDIDDNSFVFPQPFELKTRLKDLLEDEVDEKYYLSEKILQRLQITDNTFSKNIIGTTKPEFRTIGQRDSVFNPNGVMGTLVATDYNQPKQILESKRLFGVFDTDKSKHQAGSVWDSNGLAPTLDTMQGGYRQPCVVEDKVVTLLVDDTQGFESEPRIYKEYSPTLRSSRQGFKIVQVCDLLNMNGEYNQDGELEPKIITHNIKQQVKVRKYEVDSKKLVEVLREQKQKTGLTNKQLSEKLNLPLTKIEHWFRQDNSFAIPDADIWFELKKLLNIETNEFDLPITEFEYKDNIFEKSNRCYHEYGLSPTLTSTSADEKIITKFRVRKLTPKECWRLMGFDDEDIDKCIAAGLSNSQLYKQAGNSIVVNVIKEIFKSLFKNYETDLNKI